jgi:NAD+ synthase (glutamine-hydrolysing)
VRYFAETEKIKGTPTAALLEDILATPVSPELLPASEGAQNTEEIIGPYELHDFFLYYFVRQSFSPKKILRIANQAWGDVYSPEIIKKWLDVFISRFFSQQFKRSCLPDGVKIGSVSLSPRADFRMPSDISGNFLR